MTSTDGDVGGPRRTCAKSQNKPVFSDDEEMNQYEQTMDYREMMKEQANQAIDEDFGDMLVIPIPEVSEKLSGRQ